MRAALCIAAVLLVMGCGDSKSATSDSTTAKADSSTPATVAALPVGEHMLAVPDGRIWYKKSGTGSGTPVILAHGGPGFNSYYLKPLEAIGSDRVVVRYDQLGGGKSDRMTDTALFNIAHFVRELDSLRASLGYEKVHLVGHSWGTILVYEYYRAHPEHVASLVLASAVMDIPAYEKRARSLVATLSDSAQRAIKDGEAAKKYDTPAYQNAINEFFGKYVFRHPVEADLDSTFKGVNEGIYNYMQGPSEFTITGTLKKYDVRSGLKDIKVPTLYTVGEFDEVGPALIRSFAAATPGATAEVIPGAAHLTTWDNPEAMLKVVRAFLLRADSVSARR